jgi:hypothetical protein
MNYIFHSKITSVTCRGITYNVKGRTMNTLESFHIYKKTKAKNQINNKLMAKGNEIFEVILQHDP